MRCEKIFARYVLAYIRYASRCGYDVWSYRGLLVTGLL
jgi:hypothetical protein